MNLTFFLILRAALAEIFEDHQNISVSVNVRKSDRYRSQFKEMFAALYDNEDMSKTYDYGCYCGNLGDQPSTGVRRQSFISSPYKIHERE